MTEQDRLDFWTATLRLPGFRVVHFRQDTPSDPVLLTVRPDSTVALCPSCSQPCDVVHRVTDSDRVKDLPVGPHSVELTVRTPQFRCEHCHSFFTPRHPAFAPGAHATERFLEHAAKLIRFSDITNAAAFLNVPEKTLERWYYDYAERLQSSPPLGYQPIRSLGIDELSLKKSTGSSLR